jgi:hypothetical protein
LRCSREDEGVARCQLTQRNVGLTRPERKRKLRRKETEPDEESTAEGREKKT